MYVMPMFSTQTPLSGQADTQIIGPGHQPASRFIKKNGMYDRLSVVCQCVLGNTKIECKTNKQN